MRTSSPRRILGQAAGGDRHQLGAAARARHADRHCPHPGAEGGGEINKIKEGGGTLPSAPPR